MPRMVWDTLEVPTRHAPFGGATGEFDIWHLGEDWSGATFKLVVADSEGGAIRITLNNAAAGSEGVSATYDSTLTDPTSGEVLGGTIIRAQIDETSLEALTWGSDPTVPLDMWWELLVTPVGEPQRQHGCGTLRIYPGAGD